MADVLVTVMLNQNVDFDAAEVLLAQAGLRVTGRLRSIGAFNGSIDSEALAKLHAVPGVLDISESLAMPGPSPDSDIQ